MKRLISIICYMLVICQLCGCEHASEKCKELDEAQISTFEMQERNESSDSISKNEELKQIDAKKITNNALNNSKKKYEDSSCEKIEFNSYPNKYTAYFARKTGSYSLCSYITDLDNNGKNEAFVISGMEDNPDSLVTTDDEDVNYWWVDKAWFVDEEENIEELNELSNGGVILSMTQKKFNYEKHTYIILNGYKGLDGVGEVYTVKNNELMKASTDMNMKGHKDFDGQNLIWNMEYYGKNIDDSGITGHIWMPYRLYYYKDGNFKLYGAREISKDKVTEMAEIDLKYLKSAKKVQYILRDNYELDINYMNGEAGDYTVNSKVYNLSADRNTWEDIKTLNGYFLVDMNNYEETDFLKEWEKK